MDIDSLAFLFRLSDHPSIIMSGVNHAAKYMSKEQITDLAEEFFRENSWPLGETRRLSLSFLDWVPEPQNGNITMGITRYRKMPGDSFTVGGVALFMPNVDTGGYIQFTQTLYHELTHVLQDFRGVKPNHSVEYERRPHEIEARRYARIHAKRKTGYSSLEDAVEALGLLTTEIKELTEKAQDLMKKKSGLLRMRKIGKLLAKAKEKQAESNRILEITRQRESTSTYLKTAP